MLLATFLAYGTTPDLAKLRSDFRKASSDESAAEQLLENLKTTKSRDPLQEGYLAATEALMAKYAFIPTSKYSWCKRAISRFETAIQSAPENLELRYLRIAVEANLPSFLNMSGDVETDKKKIMQLLPSSQDADLNRDAANLLLSLQLCTKNEEAIICKYVQR